MERANSCPICRAPFNSVELSHTLGGPVVSSYPVADKQQVAEIDPSMLVDEDFEDPASPCLVCSEYGDDERLLLCDGCDGAAHTYCMDLEAVPVGSWYCTFCQNEQTQERQRNHRPRPRTRARQIRAHQTQGGSTWTRIWQSVFRQLDFDLDFPFANDDETPSSSRTLSQRREFREWQRRFQVADRQGGATRFRAAASALLERTPLANVKPVEESQEEIRAWNHYEKARELSQGSVAGVKRKSATTSPSDRDPEPERKLKRPGTRHPREQAEPSAIDARSSSGSRRYTNSSPRPAQPVPSRGPRPGMDANGAGPSFLQSLLREVETSNTDRGAPNAATSLNVNVSISDHTTPLVSSPGPSPVTSNHPSPRPNSVSPPPFVTSRPCSPTPLTSSVRPMLNGSRTTRILPYSLSDGPQSDSDSSDSSHVHTRHPRSKARLSPNVSPSRLSDASPTRKQMSIEDKSAIQQMVKAVLKPRYRKEEINADQYTDVNRDVSRMLYDRIGESSVLTDPEERERFERLAAEQVENAINAVKEKSNVPKDPGPIPVGLY